MLRSSRELSNRVEIDVHSHPNRFRRATWWLALWAGVGSLLWLSWQTVLGEHQIYQAGPVSLPHRLIENDCAKCHTTWTPLKRLNPFRKSDNGQRDESHSIDSTKCETCHRVAEHHANQVPAHHKVSCAACHQEHEGPEMLTRPSDRHCVACHRDLKSHGGQGAFANKVTGFDELGGHPDFLLTKLLNGEVDSPPSPSAEGTEKPEEHAVVRTVEKFQPPDVGAVPRWQDRGRIRFNHAKHLHAKYENGDIVEGLIDENRKLIDLSHRCEVCHETDHERRFLKPIKYDPHCRKCHPLLFDQEQFPGKAVPHETPDIVRGFLTELYTLRAVRGEPEAGSGKREADDMPARPIPGHRDSQRLTKAQAQDVGNAVAKAEAMAQQHRHTQFGYEAAGGCRYCHEVEPVAAKIETSLAVWRIVKTNIPERWLIHSEFHHEAHRLLGCTACHADVLQSKSTGDVLIPSIVVCRACHSENPAQWVDGLPAEKVRNEDHSLKRLLSKSMHGARSDCVECHRYHDPTKENLNGRLGEK